MENRVLMDVPMNCSKCGKLFDLKYDLYQTEEGSVYRNYDQTLCWSCRESSTHINGNDSDSNNVLELELELEDI
jgi:hypothetical protein